MESEGNSVLAGLSDAMAEAVEKAADSLVNVHGSHRFPSSGIVYAPGMVMTASRALERDEDITVSPGGGEPISARLVGRDHSSGIAVLGVEGLDAPAASAAPGDVRIGQVSLAAGRSARSGGVKASFGIVGGVGPLRMPFGRGRGKFGKMGGGPFGKGRGRKSSHFGGDVIQSDAALYPGMSGGALLDARGDVLGIIAAFPMRGATFAIPAAVAWEAAKRLESGGGGKPGYLGILTQPVSLPASQREGVGQSLGLLIVGVEDGSPADRGGVMVGDILVRLDGESVEDAEDLLSILADGKVGGEATLDVLRGGTMTSLAVTVAERD